MITAHSKHRLYLSDPGVLANFGLALAGLVIAAQEPSWRTVVLLAGGWVSYVVQEHLVHRLIFHAPAPRRQALFDLAYRLHYGHHDHPRNPHLLFTPIWFSVGMGLVNLAVVSLVLPVREALIFVYGGGVSAYVLFEWIHLTTHWNRNQGRFARYVTRRHARHHFLDHRLWFTVSPGGQLVDSILLANPATAERVDNVRTCGLPADDARLARSRQRFGVAPPAHAALAAALAD